MNDITPSQIKFAPSVIAADFTRLGEQLKEAEDAGADLIHVDVMDGRFVPNITLGPVIVEAIRRATSLPLDVHLMILEPERHIDAFAAAGAHQITVHYEATPNVYRALTMIKNHGLKAGIAINPHTPVSALIDLVSILDVINVMTVNPGFGGQEFLPVTAPKIARLRAMIEETRLENVDMEVDGGVNTDTVRTVVQAGANILVVGTSLFQHPGGVKQGIKELRDALEE